MTYNLGQYFLEHSNVLVQVQFIKGKKALYISYERR